MRHLIFLILFLLLNIIAFFKNDFNIFLPYINASYFLFLIIYKLLKSKNRVKYTDTHLIENMEIESEEIVKKEELNEESDNSKNTNCPELENIINQLANRFYFFKQSVPIIEALAKSTKEFEEITLKKVFDQFEHIWNESETIVKESEITMKSIFDTNTKGNLGYILDSSKDINRDFSNFLPVLDSMSKLTETFIDTSVDSLKSISETTKDIQDLAEQVKVISINVRIEAARVKDSGGFKVLGEDITNFADKTTLFAQTTDDNIQSTLETIEQLRVELSNKLKNVEAMVQSMYKKVNPFEDILEKSATSLKDVINDLNKVSGELNSNLKMSLGNLQYQDVTSQETAHIIDFLKYIEELNTHGRELESNLSNEEKTKIKKDILIYLDNISTTGNEADRINEFASRWNVKYKEEHSENYDELDDGTFLF